MTREEAIFELGYVKDFQTPKRIEAIDMAIEALKREPCNDCISREDALQALCQAVHKNDNFIPCSNQRVSCHWNKTKVQDYAKEILKLPSVTPQSNIEYWIPVSERLPLLRGIHKISDDVLITNGYEIDMGYLVNRKGRIFWHFYGSELEFDIKGKDNDVTAWIPLPLPEPHKAESEAK